MSLWKIAWRSIQQRALASILTAFAMGLGVALVVAVLVIYGVIDQSFRRGSQGYDLIVGPKAGSLDVVLNTVFYLGNSPGVIPYEYYEELNSGRFSSAVETAVPVALGHAYRGFPVIATIPDMFDRLAYMGDKHYEFSEGHNLQMSEPFSAVVGSVAAKKLHLKLGETIRPSHTGVVISDKNKKSEDEDHHPPFKIVGILKHTGTPCDQGIFINLDGFYDMPCHNVATSTAESYLKKKDDASAKTEDDHDHAKDADHEDEHKHGPKMLSAVLVCSDWSRPKLAMNLPAVINEEPEAMAIAPVTEIAKLFDSIVGNVQLILLILAVLVVVVAGVGILVSIYNSMNDRRHSIAVMRALGASRVHVGSIILLESILLSIAGGLSGLLMGHGLVACLGPTIAENLGIIVNPFAFQLDELILIPGLLILAAAVGYVPAAVAYRTDVAKGLAQS
jgi:putative ABC transport system permease protein